jgi:DNA-binding response OmpR family regulator
MKSFSSYSILYAEDNEDTHQMVSLMCKFADIKVSAAETVAEAWQIAQSEHFDLYLLDIRFADGDGLELCRRLREYAPHTPILIYSGCAFEEDKKRGLAARADDYLTKPYLGNIAETIRQNIEQNKLSARQTETINR